MIRLATVIDTFEADFLAQYRDQLTPDHYRALAAMKHCRSQASPMMQVKCTACEHQARLSPWIFEPNQFLARRDPEDALNRSDRRRDKPD